MYGHVVGSDPLGHAYVVPLAQVLEQLRHSVDRSTRLSTTAGLQASLENQVEQSALLTTLETAIPQRKPGPFLESGGILPIPFDIKELAGKMKQLKVGRDRRREETKEWLQDKEKRHQKRVDRNQERMERSKERMERHQERMERIQGVESLRLEFNDLPRPQLPSVPLGSQRSPYTETTTRPTKDIFSNTAENALMSR